MQPDKPKKVAFIAVARKLLTILKAVVRDGAPCRGRCGGSVVANLSEPQLSFPTTGLAKGTLSHVLAQTRDSGCHGARSMANLHRRTGLCYDTQLLRANLARFAANED